VDHLSHQERLEAVWESLKMPDKQRLDMAIKYSTIDKRSLMDHVLDLWEAAAEAVLKREAIISELEAFERQASDPTRFFDRGLKYPLLCSCFLSDLLLSCSLRMTPRICGKINLSP
jgi:hypothetical protein